MFCKVSYSDHFKWQRGDHRDLTRVLAGGEIRRDVIYGKNDRPWIFHPTAQVVHIDPRVNSTGGGGTRKNAIREAN